MDFTDLANRAGVRYPAPPPFPNKFVISHTFDFLVNLASNSIADVDLTLGAVLATDPTFAAKFGNVDNPQVVLVCDSIQPIVIGAPILDISERLKLFRNLQIKHVPEQQTEEYFIGLHALDPYSDRTLATADDTARFDGLGPFYWPGGSRAIDLHTDEFALTWRAASPTISGGTDIILRIRGAACPRVAFKGRMARSAEIIAELAERYQLAAAGEGLQAA